MIVQMKKITVLCLERGRDASLEELQDLGVVHVTPVRDVQGASIESSRERLEEAIHAMDALDAHRDHYPHLLHPPEPAKLDVKNAPAIVERVTELLKRRAQLQEQCDHWLLERSRVEHFGHFEPEDVEKLKAGGVNVELFKVPRNQEFVAPEGTVVETCGEDLENTYIVVAGRGEIRMPEHAVPVRLPERPLSEVESAIAHERKDLEHIESQLRDLATHLHEVEIHVTRLREHLHRVEVRESMGTSKDIVYLNGFCPVSDVPKVHAAAARNGWGLVEEDPADDDPTPTLIRNPVWVKPIRAVFDVIGVVPGYHEIDISAVFLLFFSVFFAILVGDAGYGAIFLVGTLLARAKFKKAPAYPFHLLMVLSVCTIIWGVITGNYFGVTELPEVGEAMKVGWLTDKEVADNNLIKLCFLIGSIHLTVAHAWNALRVMNSLKALAQLGWICITWTMYFTARTMILGAEFPPVMYYVLGAGMALVVLFMTAPREFKTEWSGHVMLPLDVISNFVDVVSYVRLFAVGSASLAVASSFNAMALGNGVDGVVAGLGAALILLLGHVLNIVLAAMGILVHGVRLNTLEFSGHIGMQWSGRQYDPFKRQLDDSSKTEK